MLRHYNEEQLSPALSHFPSVLAPLLIFLPRAAMQQLGAFIVLLPCFGIDLAQQKRLLPLEFAPILQPLRIKPALGNRRLHGAVRLGRVPAVAVSASRRQLFNVRECALHSAYAAHSPTQRKPMSREVVVEEAILRADARTPRAMLS